MGHLCAVRGCKKEAYPGCGLSFHKVPVNGELKTKWMEALQLEHLPNSSKVCGLHFKDEDFVSQAQRRLKPDAIPTISTKAVKYNTPLTWASLQATLDPLSDVHQVDLSELRVSTLSEVDEDSHGSPAAKSSIEASTLSEVDENYSNGSPAPKSESTAENEVEKWMSWPDVCRCCLAARGVWDLTASYAAEDGETEVYLQMLADCYGIKLSHVSEFGPSRLVCAECVASLRRANRFKRQVMQAQEKFAIHRGKLDSSLEVKEEDECADQESYDETAVPQTSPQHHKTPSNLRTEKQPAKRKMETTEDKSDNYTPLKGPSEAPLEPMKEITYNKRNVQVISYCPKNYDNIKQIENNNTGSAKRIKIQCGASATDNTSVTNLDQNQLIQMVSVHSMNISQKRPVQTKCHVSNINCP